MAGRMHNKNILGLESGPVVCFPDCGFVLQDLYSCVLDSTANKSVVLGLHSEPSSYVGVTRQTSVAVRVMSEPVKHTSSASRAVGAIPHTFIERWIYDEGEWWHSANL